MSDETYSLPEEFFEISRLIKKHLSGEITEDETQRLNDWIKESNENKQLFEQFTDPSLLINKLEQMHEVAALEDEAKSELFTLLFPLQVEKKGIKRLWPKLVAAASVALLLGSGIYYWYFNKKDLAQGGLVSQEQRFKNDVDPGAYKAKLTLSDGKVIILDSIGSGFLSTQGNVAVSNRDGRLVYEKSADPAATEMLNTLSTSVGESYPVTLSDGTRAWLNASSSITYPVSFAGKERPVTVSGEVYFEVAKNAAQPFVVNIYKNNGSEKSKVTVLGTHFSVKSYDDEDAIRTTLAEGSVRFETADKTLLLKPGQQAVASGNAVRLLDNINVEKEIAWVNEDFYFAGDDVRSVMRQLSRWYGITVTFEGPEPKKTFSGMISRNNKLATVLRLLEESKVKFKIEDKNITVLPE